MISKQIFKSKPGKLLAKGTAKTNVHKSKEIHPDYIGVYEDKETGKMNRIALWLSDSKKDGKVINLQITELDEQCNLTKGDLF